MNKQRRGIAPYIGAVLLVVIAISVGFFLSQWYSLLVKSKSESYEQDYNQLRTCERIAYSYYGMIFNKTGHNYFEMYIKNQGNLPITLENIIVYGYNGNSEIINSTYYIPVGSSQHISFPINTTKIDKIDLITASIKECPDKTITIEGYEISNQ